MTNKKANICTGKWIPDNHYYTDTIWPSITKETGWKDEPLLRKEYEELKDKRMQEAFYARGEQRELAPPCENAVKWVRSGDVPVGHHGDGVFDSRRRLLCAELQHQQQDSKRKQSP